MADTKTSDLPNAAALSGSELVPVVQSGGNVKLALSALLAWITAALLTRLLPTGGATRQALAKTSATDYDVSWQTLREVPDPTPATNGQVVTRVAGSPAWASLPDQSAGSAGDVQIKGSPGGFAAASKTKIGTSGSLELLTDNAPPLPTSGRMAFFARPIANRQLPSFVGPSGLDSALQPFWGRNKIGYWAPTGNSSAAPLADGIAAPTLTGTAGARNVATTNLLTSTRRLANASAATAGASGGWRHAVAQFFRSTSAWGGFFFVCRFGEDNTLADSRCFVGMHTATTAIGNVNPSTLLNIIGMGFDSGETTWRILHNDGAGTATKIDLGADYPCNTADQAYEIAIFAPPGQSSVWVQVTRLGTSFSTTVEITTDLPALNTLLTFHLWCNNGTTAAAKTINMISAYIETDY